MSFGIVELITLLLGMSGFGLSNNPKAPAPDQALQYAMADADVVAYFDVASVVPGNYKVLTQLADQPQIKASPDLAKVVRKAIGEVEGARGIAKLTTGIDVTTDLDDVEAFFQIVPHRDPSFVVAVHGRFKADVIDKIGKMTQHTSVRSGAGQWVETGDGNGVGLTRDGVLIAGTLNLVKDRVGDAWRAPAHPAGSNLGYAAEMVAGHPVFGVSMTLSATAKAEMLKDQHGQNYATDVIKRGKMAGFALYRDGMGWSWVDSTKAGLEAMAEVSDGMVDFLRAAQLAPRGVAKIALGALESYRGTDRRIDDLIRHKADLMKIVDAYVGDGTFKAQIDKDPRTLRLTARLTGKSLSEVVPLGGLVPLGVAGALLFRGEAEAAPPVMMPAPPAPAPRRR